MWLGFFDRRIHGVNVHGTRRLAYDGTTTRYSSISMLHVPDMLRTTEYIDRAAKQNDSW